MNTFIPHVMPGMPPNQASMLSMLMATAIVADEESLSSVHSKVIKSILQKMHVSSMIPTSIYHGPMEMGGLGLYDLRTEAGLEALNFFLNALFTNSEAGNLIRQHLQYSQRESEVGYHLMSYPT